MKLLVADDDPIGRSLLVAMVERWGYEVVSAADGEEAWAILEGDEPPQMAIVDWEMPGVCGPELCQRVRWRQGADYVYIILLTVRQSRADTIAGLDAGADDYITKPPEPAELRARLRAGERIVGLVGEFGEARRTMALAAAADPLTGLLNPQPAVERLGQELSRARRRGYATTVALTELDAFEALQDTHGHRAGQLVLAEFARHLQALCRPYDICARYGIARFLVALAECPAEHAGPVAQRINDGLSARPCRLDSGQPLAVSASFGKAYKLLQPSRSGSFQVQS